MAQTLQKHLKKKRHLQKAIQNLHFSSAYTYQREILASAGRLSSFHRVLPTYLILCSMNYHG